MEENHTATPAIPAVPKAQYWREVLATWKTSGERQTAFCRTRDISRNAFVYWKRHLMPPDPSVSPTFVRVALNALPSARESSIAIVLDSRYRIEVRGAVDPQTLRQVVAVMEGMRR
jgi:hypothetical protein